MIYGGMRMGSISPFYLRYLGIVDFCIYEGPEANPQGYERRTVPHQAQVSLFMCVFSSLTLRQFAEEERC